MVATESRAEVVEGEQEEDLEDRINMEKIEILKMSFSWLKKSFNVA